MDTMVRSRRRHRRRLRQLELRASRLVRHHYLSMLSACVLGGALTLALTGSTQDPAGERPRSATPTTAGPAVAAATPVRIAAVQSPAPASRLLIYYVISDAKKRNELEMAVQADAVQQSQWGLLPAPTFRYYLVVTNASQEAEAISLLNELALLAPTEGYRLRVMDMR